MYACVRTVADGLRIIGDTFLRRAPGHPERFRERAFTHTRSKPLAISADFLTDVRPNPRYRLLVNIFPSRVLPVKFIARTTSLFPLAVSVSDLAQVSVHQVEHRRLLDILSGEIIPDALHSGG